MRVSAWHDKYGRAPNIFLRSAKITGSTRDGESHRPLCLQGEQDYAGSCQSIHRPQAHALLRHACVFICALAGMPIAHTLLVFRLNVRLLFAWFSATPTDHLVLFHMSIHKLIFQGLTVCRRLKRATFTQNEQSNTSNQKLGPWVTYRTSTCF